MRISKCEVCGVTIEQTTNGQLKKYCSPNCREKARKMRVVYVAPVRNCRLCGKEFTHRQTGHVYYCSDECANESREKQKKRIFVPHPASLGKPVAEKLHYLDTDPVNYAQLQMQRTLAMMPKIGEYREEQSENE